jgi:hypothetical protein
MGSLESYVVVFVTVTVTVAVTCIVGVGVAVTKHLVKSFPLPDA